MERYGEIERYMKRERERDRERGRESGLLLSTGDVQQMRAHVVDGGRLQGVQVYGHHVRALACSIKRETKPI